MKVRYEYTLPTEPINKVRRIGMVERDTEVWQAQIEKKFRDNGMKSSWRIYWRRTPSGIWYGAVKNRNGNPILPGPPARSLIRVETSREMQPGYVTPERLEAMIKAKKKIMCKRVVTRRR